MVSTVSSKDEPNIGPLVPTLLRSIRIPFLVLTPVCIGLGVATALRTHPSVDMFNLLLALVGAVAAHMSVNLFNETLDYRSGLDERTQRTPFSGGSGALVANPSAVSVVFRTGLAALGVTVATGLWLAGRSGLGILPIGILGILIILNYSNRINRHPLLCLLAPGIGVGPLMVVGTHRVLTGDFEFLPVFVSLVPLLLVSNLLLLNQFPDRDADLSVGRRHFPIAYGFGPSVVVYGTFVAASAGVIVIGMVANYLPQMSGVALMPLSLGAIACVGAAQHAGDTGKLLPYLGMNALAAILTPLVLAVSLLIP